MIKNPADVIFRATRALDGEYQMKDGYFLF